MNDGEVARPDSPPRLLIVGLGMAGFGLCDRLVRLGAISDYEVTVIGEEPRPAYDRVNLSKLFSGKSAKDLELASPDWYREHSIQMVLGRRVVSIDRQAKRVQDSAGESHGYDKLVLATGSHAWVPPIEGADAEGVFVYRTLDDLETIRQFVTERNATVGAVIGGGLLGLEAAKVLSDLGLKTHVIEMAPGLMPRQLDADGAALLKTHIESSGVDVHLVRRTQSIQETSDGLVEIQFENADPLAADIIVVAAGIRPNDQLALPSGLEKGTRGGIVVDESLATSDPDIFAIGECASFQDHTYGLVAPCYRMADVLANRLAGGAQTFETADESAELKLLGIQVATLGAAIGEAPGVTPLVYSDGESYRKLLIERGKVVGASCVGDWQELPLIRQAVHRQSFLWPWQRLRFNREGVPWPTAEDPSVHDWPGDAIVCSCLGVSKEKVLDTIEMFPDKPVDVGMVATACGASTACGSCRGVLTELTGGKPAPTVTPGARTMVVASVVALLATASLLAVGPIASAESVQSAWRSIDVLWRDDLARQISGFSLLGITVVGMLFSVRKRTALLNKIASYGFWRAFHGVIGALALIGMMVHTGMRLGSGLNGLLGLFFVATILLGAIAGVIASLENGPRASIANRARVWRGRLAKVHLYVTWPLPLLIVLHILSFYWFSD